MRHKSEQMLSQNIIAALQRCQDQNASHARRNAFWCNTRSEECWINEKFCGLQTITQNLQEFAFLQNRISTNIEIPPDDFRNIQATVRGADAPWRLLYRRTGQQESHREVWSTRRNSTTVHTPRTRLSSTKDRWSRHPSNIPSDKILCHVTMGIERMSETKCFTMP